MQTYTVVKEVHSPSGTEWQYLMFFAGEVRWTATHHLAERLSEKQARRLAAQYNAVVSF